MHRSSNSLRRRPLLVAVLGAGLIFWPSGVPGQTSRDTQDVAHSAASQVKNVPSVWTAYEGPARPIHPRVGERIEADLSGISRFRPGYGFWQHVFMIPDGRVVFGSADDGRLLAVFSAGGDWIREGRWHEDGLDRILAGRTLPRRLTLRRQEVAELLEEDVGPVLHNATRGDFLLPNLRRYGAFVEEWGRIYERFGVPAELGLAQAVVESGLDGRIRSEARALGLCQWLPGNWEKMKRLDPTVLEGYNQTTQAAYCAAHLVILSSMYGSYIPALSEHHAGGTNVGRTVINGRRLGGMNTREQYLLGADLAMDLRAISAVRFRDVVRTYGPRSYRYAEMVFGNAPTVRRIREEVPQERIFAMRVPRAFPLSELIRRTGLPAEELRRFNPALVRQVPAGATLYLPRYDATFGRDVSFWHQTPDSAYLDVLADLLTLDADAETWRNASFRPVLADLRRRFGETGTEEGRVMATTLGYLMDNLYTSRRSGILAEFESSPRIRSLVRQGIEERRALESRSTVAR